MYICDFLPIEGEVIKLAGCKEHGELVVCESKNIAFRDGMLSRIKLFESYAKA